MWYVTQVVTEQKERMLQLIRQRLAYVEVEIFGCTIETKVGLEIIRKTD